VRGIGGPLEKYRFAIALGAIALVALVIRIAFVVIVAPTVPRLGDANAYHLLAEQLAVGKGYIRPFDHLLLHLERPTAEYPPLFPLLLSFATRFGLDTIEQQRIFLSFVGAGTVTLVGLLGRRVAGRAVGLAAAALAAVYPMLFLSEATLMSESLYVALVTLVLLCAYRAYDDPKPSRFVVLGVAIGAATLTRAEGLLLGAVVVASVVVALRRLPSRERLARVAIALGVAVVLLVPWTIRNALQLHAFVPVSNNAATLVDGANCDVTYRGTQLGLWRASFATGSDQARLGIKVPQSEACFEGFDIGDPHFDEAKASNADLRAGASYARHHLGSLPKVAAVRVLRTWGVYSPGQQVSFESLEGRPRAWQMRGTVMYWFLAPLAVVGAVLLRRRKRLIAPLVATAVTVTIGAALTYGQQRFRIAAEPAILVLAAVPLVALARGARNYVTAVRLSTGVTNTT
jgi:4-amino-4-deoxy-L-arabinose transferase-like glycosyltransferase